MILFPHLSPFNFIGTESSSINNGKVKHETFCKAQHQLCRPCILILFQEFHVNSNQLNLND